MAAGTLYTLALKMNMTTIGTIMLLPRVWDAILHPLMGNISDNTRCRWGRRRPYILAGGIATGILFYLTMSPPAFLEEKGVLGYFFAMSIFYFTAYTVFAIPYCGLGLELSADYHERTRVMAFRAFFTAIGGMVAGSSMWITFHEVWGSPRTGMRITGLVFGTVAALAAIMTVLGTREAPAAQSQSRIGLFRALRCMLTNKQFLILCAAISLYVLGLYVIIPLYPILSSYYVYNGDLEAASRLEFVRGALCASLMLGTIFPITWLGTRLGKKWAFVSCMVIGVAGAGSTWFLFVPSHPHLQLLASVILAFALPAIQVYPMAIMADICDLDELATGLRREGIFGASFGLIINLVLSLTVLLAGVVLDISGIDQKAKTQTPEALYRLRLIVALLPAAMISLSAMLLTTLDVSEKKVQEVREILNGRRSAAAPPETEERRGGGDGALHDG